jgi:biopolymer transport protein ExbD
MRRFSSVSEQLDMAPEFEPWGVAEGAGDRHDRLIPMINIVFLLLVFFLVAGTFRAAETLAIDPPVANSEGQLDADAFTVLIKANGSLGLAGREANRERVVAEAESWLAEHADGELQIRADRALQAGVLLPLLHELKKAGAGSVRLVVIKREDRP